MAIQIVTCLIDTVALRKHASYNYITTCINIVPEVVTEILRWIVIMYRFEDDAVELGFAPGQIHETALGAPWHGQGSPSSMPGPMGMQLPMIVHYL